MNRAIAILMLLALPVGAATNTAANLTQAEVQSKIAMSATGDTVLLPAGMATWSSLALTNAIALIGAGTNSTKISCSGQAVSIALVADLPVRLSGILFTNSASAPTVDVWGPLTAFRVDRCLFGKGKRALYVHGYSYGVVDHCVFMNCDIAISPEGDGNASWLRPILPGTTNALVAENNVFYIDNGAGLDLNEQIYHWLAPRTVMRFNVFEGRNYTTYNCVFYEAHGNQDLYPNGQRGTVFTEVYGNTMLAHHTYRFLYFRAGMNFVYSNTMTTVSGSPTPNAIALSEEESWQTQFFNPLKTVWPAQDQITNNFFWANTLNGAAVTSVALWNANDPPFIQAGRDYWMEAPSGANGLPTGAWASYAPLPWPHPMVTAQDGLGPSVAFTGTPRSGTAPLQVTFTDTSSGSPTTWLWDFKNDGTATSTSQNPSYTYTQAGNYTVKLTAGNANGTNSATYSAYITVSAEGEPPASPGGIIIRANSVRVDTIVTP